MRTKSTARRQQKKGQRGHYSSSHGKRRSHSRPMQTASVIESTALVEPLGSIISRCSTLPWTEVRSIVDQCSLVVNSGLQVSLLQVLLRRLLSGQEPHVHQVRALRRLVFGIGDTLLIAMTGFGKSIVFQAYSIITGRITIQIIPLSRLGNEQYETLRSFEGANPCLVTAETKFVHPGLLLSISACQYTHVLLGPEQAMSPEFRKVVQSPLFQSEVGLVAIDECHVLHQWAEFRTAYSALHELRRSLPSNVVFFGCSATITASAETTIKKHAGFLQPEAIGGLQTIRVSVDRPDISTSFVPIPRGQITKYTLLASVIFSNRPSTVSAGTQWIRKTIVFLDSRLQVTNVAAFLKQGIIYLGWPAHIANQTVGIYTSRVAEFDQTRLYKTFEQQMSSVRIMVATTALGMGMDLGDVDDVMQWGLQATKDIADLWQRFGRAPRKSGHTGRAIMFTPYWLFNDQGYSSSMNAARSSQDSQPSQEAKRSRHKMRQDRIHSTLRREVVRSDSNAQESASYAAVQGVRRTTLRNEKVVAWTKQDLQNRENVPSQWLDCINALCRRKAILEHLQNDKAESDTHPVPAPASICCNGAACNPALVQTQLLDLPSEVEETAPSDSSRAGVALRWIQNWCVSNSNLEDVCGCSPEDLCVPMPSGYFMPSAVQWSVARTFTPGVRATSLYAIKSIEDLGRIPTVRAWDRFDEWGDNLVCFLNASAPRIIQQYDMERSVCKQQSYRLSASVVADGSNYASDSIERRLGMDEVLARQACLRRAITGSQGPCILEEPLPQTSQTMVATAQPMFGVLVPSSPVALQQRDTRTADPSVTPRVQPVRPVEHPRMSLSPSTQLSTQTALDSTQTARSCAVIGSGSCRRSNRRKIQGPGCRAVVSNEREPLRERDPNKGIFTMASASTMPRKDGRERRSIKLSALAKDSGLYQGK